ncbi:CidA/LrgA family protein [Lysinibacillus odysseyi]|uniref:Holin n=1 Tax=Lysinibacillus odysseyi 34hs-1 = NBRC 100172 TaxID=1220589 RepID=A0A0A3IKF9_9BACI|nr:CidA/LrgA family protein [Lysinibacillus odysseyi]KGR83960.1 holin [Lysinibacillus odysseyi 34hs-1 = NBRC 100172]
MKIIRIIAQVGILWLFYFIGVLIVEWTGIFIPPSIIGLVLLWALLMLNIIKVKLIQEGAGFLIAFLTLFFIPATVGVVDYPELLTVSGLLLVLAVFLSTIVTIIATGKLSQYIERKEQAMKEDIGHASTRHHS